MRGYVVAPATGNDTFHVSGDDSCQLWLSPSDSQFAKKKIAFIDGYTNLGQWNKFEMQASTAIGDLDGDDLANAAEWKAGTRADLADTDGDGVDDADEVSMGASSALSADLSPQNPGI